MDKIQTPGGVGGDTAEDVMGGLKAALTKLTWRASGTKVRTLYTKNGVRLPIGLHIHVGYVSKIWELVPVHIIMAGIFTYQIIHAHI